MTTTSHIMVSWNDNREAAYADVILKAGEHPDPNAVAPLVSAWLPTFLTATGDTYAVELYSVDPYAESGVSVTLVGDDVATVAIAAGTMLAYLSSLSGSVFYERHLQPVPDA